MNTTITNRLVKESTIDETAKYIIDLFLFNINTCPITEFQKVVLDLYFSDFNQKEIFKREISKNNEIIYNVVKKFYKDIPQFSIQFYSILLRKFENLSEVEKVNSLFCIDLKDMSFSPNKDILVRNILHDILYRFAYHHVYIYEGGYVDNESIKDYLFDLKMRLDKLNNINNIVDIIDNVKRIDCKYTIKAIDEDVFFKELKILFTRIILNFFYYSNIDNQDVLSIAFSKLVGSNDLIIHNSRRDNLVSYEWISDKLTVRELYDKLLEFKLLDDSSDFISFNNCFNNSLIEKRYKLKDRTDSAFIYLMHLLINFKYINCNSTNFDIKKFKSVFSIKTNEVSSILSRINSDNYNAFPFSRSKKKLIDSIFSNISVKG